MCPKFARCVGYTIRSEKPKYYMGVWYAKDAAMISVLNGDLHL